MPPRFVRRRKKFNRRRKKAYLNNRSAKSQALQLSRLSGKINRLENKLANSSGYFHYYNVGRQPIPGEPGPTTFGYNCFRLHPNATNWLRCLDRVNDAELMSDTWMLHKSQMQLRISIADEASNPIEFSVFIVKVKKDFRDIMYGNYGTNLQNMFSPNIPGTETPTDVSFLPFNAFSSGQVFLHPRVFTVLKRWQFTLGQVTYGNQGHYTNTLRDTYRNLSWSHRYGKRGVKLARQSESIHEAITQAEKYMNRASWVHVLVVSNNSLIDIANPELEYTTIHHLSDPQ